VHPRSRKENLTRTQSVQNSQRTNPAVDEKKKVGRRWIYAEKQHVVARTAQRFLAESHVKDIPLRFDVLAIDNIPVAHRKSVSTKTPLVHKCNAICFCPLGSKKRAKMILETQSRIFVIALLLLSGAAASSVQEIAPPGQVFDGAMMPDLEVRTFARSDELFPVRVVEKGSAARKLPLAKTPLKTVNFEAGGKHYDLFDYVALNRVAGLLILKNGEVALEDYELG